MSQRSLDAPSAVRYAHATGARQKIANAATSARRRESAVFGAMRAAKRAEARRATRARRDNSAPSNVSLAVAADARRADTPAAATRVAARVAYLDPRSARGGEDMEDDEALCAKSTPSATAGSTRALRRRRSVATSAASRRRALISSTAARTRAAIGLGSMRVAICVAGAATASQAAVAAATSRALAPRRSLKRVAGRDASARDKRRDSARIE